MARPRFVPLLLALVAGCHPADPPPPADPPLPGPDTFAAWPEMTAEPVRVTFDFWALCRGPTPAEERQMADAEKEHGPHARYLMRVRTDPAAADAFRRRQPLPVGSVVVKEKHFHPHGSPVAYALMVKRPAGYDPDHGDWEYVYTVVADEPTTTRGRIVTCVACHAKAKDTDYLFRPYRSDR